MQSTEFRDILYEELANEFLAANRIKRFITNPDVIGAHAEACVRAFIARTVAPLRVSTGAVIHETVCSDPASVPQIDTMIWLANPMPAIFDRNEFALVPRSSCFGLIEVKSSLYSGVDNKFRSFLSKAGSLVYEGDRLMQGGATLFPALGVVCVQQANQSVSNTLRPLIDQEKVVILATSTNEGDVEPNIAGMVQLTNFLSGVRTWGLLAGGTTKVHARNQGHTASSDNMIPRYAVASDVPASSIAIPWRATPFATVTSASESTATTSTCFLGPLKCLTNVHEHCSKPMLTALSYWPMTPTDAPSQV